MGLTMPCQGHNQGSTRATVGVCVCLFLSIRVFTTVVSVYCNNDMLELESGHEELIHAAAWNVSSLTSDSPRGNKEVEFVGKERKLMRVGYLGLVNAVSLPKVPAV